MPMVIDTLDLSRRACCQRLSHSALALLAGGHWASAGAAAPQLVRPLTERTSARPSVIAACWQDAQGAYHAGWLQIAGSAAAATVSVLHSTELPTRGHGLAVLPDGVLLVAARRPGDWLLRLAPGQKPQWLWQEPGRVFSGHVHVAADGRTVFTTEIDTDSGQGVLGVRDASTLQKRAEFKTHGLDPHAVLTLRAMDVVASTSPARHPLTGMLFVANGGIDTAVETGRVKRNLHQMDASIACLHPATGELLGQWRLPDPRLSLRHLAWAMPDATQATPSAPKLGVALQAEHDNHAQKAEAPLLAVLDWADQPEGRLRLADGQPALSGYGGDISVVGQGDAAHFVVSATRGHQLAHFDLTGRFLATTPLPDAGALARCGDLVWAAGRTGMLSLSASSASAPGWPNASVVKPWSGGQMDNHWLRVSG